MNIDQLQTLLGWSSLIHLLFLLFWGALILFAKDLVYRLHQTWFKIEKNRLDEIHYLLIGFYKLTVLIFCFIPYLVLRYLI